MSNDIQPVDGESLDITEHNIEQLKQLFPNVFTEGKIDFDALKSELGEHVETNDERYQFTWAGKEQAKRIATTPTLGTLRPAPEESVDWDNTENLYIEGDNLEVLKLLQKSYFNQVKMIYIDPPYNTGKDFVYKDDYKDNLANYKRLTGQLDEEGNPLSTNRDNAGRYHSNWLNMMYPRLKLARNLLKDDGVIFISIDENEVYNLRKICDEIFGEENFRNCFITRRHDKNINRQFLSSGLKSLNVGFEYILSYSKSSEFVFQPIFKAVSNKRAQYGYWKGFWNAPDRPTMRYDILGFTPKSGQWKWKEETAKEAVLNYETYKSDFSDKMTLEEYWLFTGKQKKFIRRNLKGEGQNKGVEHWIEPSEGTLRNTNLMDILATAPFKKIQGLFDFPKNIELLQLLIQLGSSNGDLILDFFAGSSTSAHAAMLLNAEKNDNRKFIMVQLPEPTPDKSEAKKSGFNTISDIGKERIRRAAAKIHEDHPDTEADLGFKVFKLDTSNIKKWQPTVDTLADDLFDAVDNIEEERTPADLLYEVLLKYGLPLTLPVEEITLGKHTAFNVAMGSLVACFDENITLDTVQAIIDLATAETPVLRVVFRDNGFKDDIVKTNAIQRLKQAGIEDILSI